MHTSSIATRTGRTRLAVKAAGIATSLVALLGASAITAAPAEAWSWSAQVHVAGSAKCDRVLYTARTVEIWPGNGEYGRAGVNWLSNYGVTFYRIGSGSTTAWAKVTCGYANTSLTYSYWRSFTMYRPAVGSQLNVSFRG